MGVEAGRISVRRGRTSVEIWLLPPGLLVRWVGPVEVALRVV